VDELLTAQRSSVESNIEGLGYVLGGGVQRLRGVSCICLLRFAADVQRQINSNAISGYFNVFTRIAY